MKKFLNLLLIAGMVTALTGCQKKEDKSHDMKYGKKEQKHTAAKKTKTTKKSKKNMKKSSKKAMPEHSSKMMKKADK